MRIVLITRDVNQKKDSQLIKYVTGSGYGLSVVGAIGGGILAGVGSVVAAGKLQSVEPVVVVNSKISAKEQKRRNDAEIEKLYSFKGYLAENKKMFDRTSEMYRILKKIEKDTDANEKIIGELYQSIHGRKPPPNIYGKKKEYSNEDMSKAYVNCVLESKIAEPTQDQLFEHSNISQPTWSRAFRERVFWMAVNETIERLWNTNSIVKDKLDKIEFHETLKKEQLVADMPSKDGKEKNLDDVSLEVDRSMEENLDKIISPFEQKRLNGLSKNKLIEEIIKVKPTIKRSDLDPHPESTLRKLLITLTA